MTIPEKLQALRAVMKANGIDIYVVPTDDFHQSEYVGEHFKARAYITGFTGSAGTAVITLDEAGLWTDGRYFLQADKQLEGTTITLRKMGEPGVPTIPEYLAEALPSGGTLGVDGRVISVNTGDEYEKIAADKGGKIQYHQDLIDQIWTDRPELSREPVFALGVEYAGETTESKLTRIREEMKKNHADKHVLTTLDDICWTLNIRGNDIPCNPVVLSYLTVTKDEIRFFVNPEAVPQQVKTYLEELGVTLWGYEDIYDYVGTVRSSRVLLEKGKVNYTIIRSLDSSNRILDKMNPTSLAKAQKNSVEIENMKAAHIKDGVTMTKFIYWMKKNIGKVPMTECTAADRLDQMRLDNGALDQSFTTISAYGANAAMCHYHAVLETCAVLEPKGLYLVDSGGQYLEGTTDITRTFALGPVTEEEKKHYTMVLMSMLRLGHVKFLQGCSGLSLDYVAREVFWKHGLDYNHGTGHGIGYLLNVHERPAGIRFRIVPERQDSYPFMDGMVCSDEPGLYIEGSHGIRTENQMFCKKAEKNEYGQFLCFEFLTYVPVDTEPLDTELMTEEDVAFLHEYHAQVYEKISPYLNDEEKECLRQVTQPVKKA